MREFSQYKFLYNCVGHYLGTLNDDDYDYIYELNEETGELVNESEAAEGVYVDGVVEETERPISVESMYVDDENGGSRGQLN